MAERNRPTTVEIPEIEFQESVKLPRAQSAVVIVDMQNDFVKQGGSLQVESAGQTIPAIRDLISNARDAGVRVVYTQDTHYPQDPEFEIWPEHCLAGTQGWQIVSELEPQENDLVVQKNRYDGFYGTSLDHMLKNVWGIKHLVIVGTVSSICVVHTAASAGLRWYNIVVPADGISSLTEFDHYMTLRQCSFLYLGNVVRSCGDIEWGE